MGAAVSPAPRRPLLGFGSVLCARFFCAFSVPDVPNKSLTNSIKQFCKTVHTPAGFPTLVACVVFPCSSCSVLVWGLRRPPVCPTEPLQVQRRVVLDRHHEGVLEEALGKAGLPSPGVCVQSEQFVARAHQKEGGRPFGHRAELPEGRLHPSELLPALWHLCGYSSRRLIFPYRCHLPHAGRMPLPNLQGALRVDVVGKRSF